MSNLGGYQMLTTLAKKVGGPGKLVALIAGGGAIAGGLAVKGGEVIVKRGKKAVAKHKRDIQKLQESAQTIYTIKKEDESNEGLKLKEGDRFRVLESDENAILIELIGNENNPYFVDADLLKTISDFE